MRHRVRVKICGITREDDLNMASDLGADAVGFVVGVPSSPRNLLLGRAEELVGQVPVFMKSVLVTVPDGADELVEACEIVRPDAVQIHGDAVTDLRHLRIRLPGTALIKGLRAGPEGITRARSAGSFDAILMDSLVPGKHGGTGIVHNWDVSSSIREAIHPRRLILAGGLNSENVAEAIKTVRPYAVDVSTGVESSPGVKDPGKIEFFIKQVREMET